MNKIKVFLIEKYQNGILITNMNLFLNLYFNYVLNYEFLSKIICKFKLLLIYIFKNLLRY